MTLHTLRACALAGLALLTLPSAGARKAPTRHTPAAVYIAAGQSNTDGRAEIEFLPDYLKRGYRHLRFANVTTGSDGHFTAHTWGKRFCYQDVVNYLLDETATEPFYAIKCALGGTAIAPGVTAAKLPLWYADAGWIATAPAYDGTNGNTASLARSLTEGFAKLARTTLSRLPQGYDVKAVLWHQGESDRHAGADYYLNLTTLIQYVRREVYRVTGREKDLGLPFILGGVPRDSRQYSQRVEDAKRRAALTVRNVYYVNLDGTSLRSDRLHFDGPGTERVGQLMYAKLREVTEGAARPAVRTRR